MWRAFFLAVGIYGMLLGVECLAIDKVVLARSADYTPTGFGPPEFGRVYKTRIGIARSAASLTITWTRTGALQAADSVEGPYQDVPGAVTSPVNIPLDKLQQFYRIRRN